MKSTGMFSSSKTFSTPMWASPRANPPPKANPIFGRCHSVFVDSSSGDIGRVSSLLNAFTERTILDNWLKRSPELGGEAAYTSFDAQPEQLRCRGITRLVLAFSQDLRLVAAYALHPLIDPRRLVEHLEHVLPFLRSVVVRVDARVLAYPLDPLGEELGIVGRARLFAGHGHVDGGSRAVRIDVHDGLLGMIGVGAQHAPAGLRDGHRAAHVDGGRR